MNRTVICSPAVSQEILGKDHHIPVRPWNELADYDSLECFLTLEIQVFRDLDFEGDLFIITTHPAKSVKSFIAKIRPSFEVYWFSSLQQLLSSRHYKEIEEGLQKDADIVWR